MKPDNRYFMTAVSLCSAKARIERILESAEQGAVPSMELIAACIGDLTSAMNDVARNQLSDPRFKAPAPECERGCGYTAEHHVCDLLQCFF